MRLFKTQNLLDLSCFADIPRGTTKELVIRFAGVSAAGKTMTLAKLGRLRLNYLSTDTHNLSQSLLSRYNNLKMGVAEFSAAVGAAFSATLVVPFHAPWDDYNGQYFGEKEAFIQLDFPALDAVEITSGTVSLHTVEAPSLAQYVLLLLQRNVQVGGAGTVSQELEMSNISSLYISEDAAVTNWLVTADKSEKINASQAALKGYSNERNRVETAVDLIELDLNPFNEVKRLLNREVKVQANCTGAVNIDLVAESFAFSDQMVQRSGVAVGLSLAKSEALLGLPVHGTTGVVFPSRQIGTVVDVA